MGVLSEGRLDNLNWFITLAAFSVVLVVSRVNSFVNGLKAVNYLPGPRVPFPPLSLPGVLLPTSWWNPGIFYVWKWRNNFYKTWASETVAFVPWLSGKPNLVTTNLEVAKQITLGGHNSSWGKPSDRTRAHVIFGMNLVSAEGEMWRKHRRIIGSAFSNDLPVDPFHRQQLVWKETYRFYQEMIEAEGWSDKDSFQVPAVQSLTFKLALLVMGNCGFGFSFDWVEPPTALDGSMSIQEALYKFTQWHMLDVFAPKWVRKLPYPEFRRYRAAFQKLKNFMQAQISERKKSIHGGSHLRKDIFTTLVKANEDEEVKLRLDDGELIGNVFVMYIAGHETTAHTLAATIGLLAVHDEIQDEVHNEIMSVIGHRDPLFSDFAQLDKVVSVFYEALRMFPAGFALIRRAKEDTVLHLPKPVGRRGTTSLPVQKGTDIIVDMVGIQYNPRYFEEPEKFKPQRWHGTPKGAEMLSAFSFGPRVCIGQKFATVEVVCFLTSLLRDWKVEPILKADETTKEWSQRVLDAKFVITLGVKDVPVRFVRRNSKK